MNNETLREEIKAKFGIDSPTLAKYISSKIEEAREEGLGELIEACGDEFGKLIKSYDKDHISGKIIIKYRAEAYNDHLYADGRGSTPEEAVKNLLQALNSHNHE